MDFALMASLWLLIPMPFLQIVLVYFAFSGVWYRLLGFPSVALIMGFLTFFLIRHLTVIEEKRPDWSQFLISCFVIAFFLNIPFAIFSILYTQEPLVGIFPFFLMLPLGMALYELTYIFRNLKNEDAKKDS
jgi:hypothetical protein